MVTKPSATRRPSPRRAEDDGSGPRREVSTASPEGPSPDGSSPDGPSQAGSSAGTATAVGPPAGRAGRIRSRARATLRIIRSNPTGRIALKVFVGLAGALVVAVGLALIPLPGPGWALVILGLAIWAIEFVWAKHLLRFTRTRVQQWTQWVKRQSWPVRILIGCVGAVFIGTVLWLSLKYSFGIDVVAKVWGYVTTH